ncbi:PAS-domain containing protein [Pelagibius marinus]|uniref:PAS-domain containing protein n=1 Tax=Pelagibius marinus TaxID=2762760 RepID=UPI0018722363|nr:PAS-domain containing protein [Pelagibius marinus]
MSKPVHPAICSPRRATAALHSLDGPLALATGEAQPRMVGANRAFVEATGWDAAAMRGRRLEDICEEAEGAAPDARGASPIDVRPLYDRAGRHRHWLVIHRESDKERADKDTGGEDATAAPGRSAEAGSGTDFRALVEGISNGVLVHRDFKPLYANAACARRVGFESGEELLREPTLLPFLPIEMHSRALRRHARLLAGETPGPARILRCLTRSGEPFWVEASEKRIIWEGEPAVLVSLNDVTEQVQMRRTELMLREAIDNLSDSFILYDSDQRVVLTNRRFHEILPFHPSQDEIVGKPMRELIEASVVNNAITDPRVLHDPERFVDEFIQERMNKHSNVREDTWPDGRWDLVKEQHTRSGGFVSVRTDITERKKAEIALRDQESRLEQTLAERTSQLKGVLANIAQGVTVTAPDQTVLLVNQGYLDIFGLPEELGRPGIHLSEYIRHGLKIGEYNPAEVAAAGGDEGFVQHRLAVLSSAQRGVAQRKLGDGRVVEIRQQRLPNGCIVSTYNNITDRVQTEQELQRQREKAYQNEKLSALGSLLAGVSHELNNPLSVVIGQAALLETMAGSGEIADRAVKVRTAADRCAKIVKTFLSMARQRPADRRPIRVNDLVRDVLDLVTHQLSTTDIEVTCNLAPELPTVAGDSDQLSHVLLNLFINAQQAMLDTPLPRRLIISTSNLPASRQVRITVRDNGPGVPDDIRSRIFDPFFTTKPVGQGTGVGLSVCHGMVSAHGGSISVDEAAGGGAVFSVLLPAGETAQAPGEEQQEEAPEPEAVARRQVLVIDDEPDITGFLVEILEASGHAVDVAASGESALAQLKQRDYQVIICDLRMPHMDGPGLYEALKALKPHLLDRIIFATGDLLNETTDSFLKSTGRPCVEKPFLPAQIRELVEQVTAENKD